MEPLQILDQLRRHHDEIGPRRDVEQRAVNVEQQRMGFQIDAGKGRRGVRHRG